MESAMKMETGNKKTPKAGWPLGFDWLFHTNAGANPKTDAPKAPTATGLIGLATS
jgi:hypothetical protein